MSKHAYEVSKEISLHDYPFYALVMAAMRQADTINLLILREGFPGVWEELQARYWAPGGVRPGDNTETVVIIEETS